MFASRRSTSSSAPGRLTNAGRMNQKANRISRAAIIQKVSIDLCNANFSLRSFKSRAANEPFALPDTAQNFLGAFTLVGSQGPLFDQLPAATQIAIQNYGAAHEKQERPEPEQVGRRLDGRLIKHEVAVAIS